ncbi:MAG TPA: FHA domain-containing protein [Thermoanaerobaculia bacterium]|nr:FHA domain-containing protein [Thermoanaerobaculia bacterium]
MREELAQIDLSPIADLVRIKGDEEILRDRLEKMEGRKEKVTALVYRRVRQDYEARKAALEAESRPLKEKARREYAKLQVLREKTERAVEEASLEKEELEFRRDLGEFPSEQFQERLNACELRLAERQAELEAVVETKSKFVSAFHTEAELEGPAPPAPAARPAPPGPPLPAPTPAGPGSGVRARPAAAAPSADATLLESPPARSADATLLEPPAARSADATVLDGPPPRSADATVLDPGSPRAGRGPAVGIAAEAPGPTVVLAMPRLVVMVDDKPGQEHVLKPGITVLGRSPKADIQVPYSEVSRKHAELVWEADGFVILDLDSENGVFVNGEKVKKRPLKDGDAIQVGPQKFVFRV